MDTTITLKRLGSISIVLSAEPEYDSDLSWDESGEVREGLISGKYEMFVAKVAVVKNGHAIGEDYLGQCIYGSLEEFAEGAKPGSEDYCRDMMHDALREARVTLGKG